MRNTQPSRYRVLPYRAGSRGANELAQGLGGASLRLTGSRFVPRRGDVIINWGNTDPPTFPCRVFNATGIRSASNKLTFFNEVSRVDPTIIPAFWTRREDIPDDAFPVVCRTVLAGHSGEGIVIADTRDGLVPAPLYVKYIKKQDEYRVHVGRETRPDGTVYVVIDVQQKKRRHDHENPDFQVRNLANGFIYAREGVNPPDAVVDVAKRALACTVLDFGAVDVIWNARTQTAYVLEINTAPGITGTTVTNYVNFFRGS